MVEEVMRPTDLPGQHAFSHMKILHQSPRHAEPRITQRARNADFALGKITTTYTALMITDIIIKMKIQN